MLVLLSWTTYGTWLAGPGRGQIGDDGLALRDHEPDARATAARAGSLKWPAVRLDADHHAALLADLPRIAALRRFTPHAMVVAADHVHLLLTCADDCDVPRLVQLVEGALSRALSVALGEAAEHPHAKWWSRQHALTIMPGDEPAAHPHVLRRLRDHGADGTTTVAIFDAPA